MLQAPASIGLLALIVLASTLHAQQDPPIPADAPTSACEFPGSRSVEALRIVAGIEPVSFVMSCPGHPGGRCNTPIAPTSMARLSTNLLAVDRTEGGWTCTNNAGVPGWVPTNRLIPLPDTPAVPTTHWLGWWRSGKDAPGIQNDRLLITRSKNNPRILHVSGRAYWYGITNNVHLGEINADAQARGPYLHIVEGDPPGCILDLAYDPVTHNFNAIDNSECGGMNVRFLGKWSRFTPTSHAVK
jgi:hypothetical protein